MSTAPRLQGDAAGKFKILQISDTHMSSEPRLCKDAIDANGHLLQPFEADPRTQAFISGVLDGENPDLVVLTGDQVHHDILDSEEALRKVLDPIVEKGAKFAAVFGNHDDEGVGKRALGREVQMEIMANMSGSLCQAGLVKVDGVGDYYLQVYGAGAVDDEDPVVTLFFLDSHGEVNSGAKQPDYDFIKPSQIEWFKRTSRELRQQRRPGSRHLALAFFHIPVPEYADDQQLIVAGGQRGEPTEGPSLNSHIYDTLVDEGVAAVGCGHDHVNDFCALRRRPEQGVGKTSSGAVSEGQGPWLCHCGGSGFGGYGSYEGKYYHRRMRVWEIDTRIAGLKTWKRVEYADNPVDEIVLVDKGAIVTPSSGAAA